jgi:hypothetical protein
VNARWILVGVRANGYDIRNPSGRHRSAAQWIKQFRIWASVTLRTFQIAFLFIPAAAIENNLRRAIRQVAIAIAEAVDD